MKDKSKYPGSDLTRKGIGGQFGQRLSFLLPHPELFGEEIVFEIFGRTDFSQL